MFQEPISKYAIIVCPTGFKMLLSNVGFMNIYFHIYMTFVLNKFKSVSYRLKLNIIKKGLNILKYIFKWLAVVEMYVSRIFLEGL